MSSRNFCKSPELLGLKKECMFAIRLQTPPFLTTPFLSENQNRIFEFLKAYCSIRRKIKFVSNENSQFLDQATCGSDVVQLLKKPQKQTSQLLMQDHKVWSWTPKFFELTFEGDTGTALSWRGLWVSSVLCFEPFCFLVVVQQATVVYIDTNRG